MPGSLVSMTPEQARFAERTAFEVFDEAPNYVDVRPRADHVALMARLGSLPLADAQALLLEASRPEHLLDPRRLDADIPWAYLVRRYRGDPELGWSVMKAWSSRLSGQAPESGEDFDTATVHPVHESSRWYLGGALCELRGRYSRSWGWYEAAHDVTEYESPAGLPIFAYIRAAKLWLGLT